MAALQDGRRVHHEQRDPQVRGFGDEFAVETSHMYKSVLRHQELGLQMHLICAVRASTSMSLALKTYCCKI